MPPDQLQTEAAAERQHAEAHEDRVDLAAQFEKLSHDVHMMKGNLAANTSITLDTAAAIDVIRASLGAIDFKELSETLDAIKAMKGGFKVLGWLERPAKWIAAIAGAAGAIWLAWQKFKS